MIFGSKVSFHDLINWITDAKALANENLAILIAGNKKDLEDQREVDPEEAANFSNENGIIPIIFYLIYKIGCLYLETSAMLGSNVIDIFQKMAKHIFFKLENGTF